MYVPPAFREERTDILHEAMQEAGLVTLVTMVGDAPFASHLPMLLEADEGPLGTLYGHVARANIQWRDSRPDASALAIFAGPDGYVSPSWYASKREHGRVVPTWNYVTVHASGPVAFFEDADRLHRLVTRQTAQREAGRPAPWAVADAPATFVQSQLRGIVGVALTIARLDGKWKLSQNRSADDRAGVVDGLAHDDAAGPLRAAMIGAGGG